MTRLDAFIRRMKAQRSCIDAVAQDIGQLTGPVLELGLGNGRTYDHLRSRLQPREIFVFDREIAAHPDCIPPPHLCRLGDFRQTVPAYLAEGHAAAAFIHGDIGSSDKAASIRLAADLAPTLLQILAPGGYLACDQPIVLDGLLPRPLPGEVDDGRYYLYQRAS
ncbi:MAG: class I SAM-dependent methyltransferase [Burkholderiaceae bacterium]